MTVLPVFDRELRTQARLAFTYWLRTLGAGALVFAAVVFGLRHGFGPSRGGRLFGNLHLTLFCSIWVLVPQFTADCISREKREGTLGLLFLTPLRAGDIVLAKGLVHGLRGLMLWLSVLPVLTIPLLMGGVTWREAVLSALVSFSCICWALSAGILASSVGRAWSRSMLLACLLGFCLCLIFIYVNGVSLWVVLYTAQGTLGRIPPATTAMFMLGGFFGATGFEDSWRNYLGVVSPAGQNLPLLAQGLTVGTSLLVLLGAIAIAARSLNRSWQDRPPQVWQVQLERMLCTPVVGVSFFRHWLRRKLERNPIGWLEQRTWSGRLTSWGWFAVTISLYSLAFREDIGFSRAFQSIQILMGSLLILSLAMSAAGSFRRERENGVLELLLVSPLSEGQIIGGRLRGLWGQFLPALVVLLGIWVYSNSWFSPSEELRGVQFCLISFATIPLIGLYFSLRLGNFMASYLSTLFMGLFLPVGSQAVLEYFFPDADRSSRQELVTVLQLIVAGLLGRRLYEDLTRRNFSFDRGVT